MNSDILIKLCNFQEVAAIRFLKSEVKDRKDEYGTKIGTIYREYYYISQMEQELANVRQLSVNPGSKLGDVTGPIIQDVYVEYRNIKGKLHNEDGPAVIKYRPDGKVQYREYHILGKLQRE